MGDGDAWSDEDVDDDKVSGGGYECLRDASDAGDSGDQNSGASSADKGVGVVSGTSTSSDVTGTSSGADSGDHDGLSIAESALNMMALDYEATMAAEPKPAPPLPQQPPNPPAEPVDPGAANFAVEFPIFPEPTEAARQVGLGWDLPLTISNQPLCDIAVFFFLRPTCLPGLARLGRNNGGAAQPSRLVRSRRTPRRNSPRRRPHRAGPATLRRRLMRRARGKMQAYSAGL